MLNHQFPNIDFVQRNVTIANINFYFYILNTGEYQITYDDYSIVCKDLYGACVYKNVQVDFTLLRYQGRAMYTIKFI